MKDEKEYGGILTSFFDKKDKENEVPEITVSEANNLKNLMEQRIKEIVLEFEAKTEMTVIWIELGLDEDDETVVGAHVIL